MTDQAKPPPRPPTHYPLALWLQLKTDYVHGKGQLAVLARKAGITVDRAHKRSAREGWSQLRSDWFEREMKKLERDDSEQQRTVQAPPLPDMSQGQTRAGTVLAQIDQIDQAIAVAEPSDLPKLADAKAKLWSLLYAKPGTSRRRRPVSSEPTLIEPQPI